MIQIEDRRNIGVGLAPLSASSHPHQHQRLQQEHGGKERLEDQRLQQADHSGHQKNVTTLTALHKWLKNLNAGAMAGFPTPMLLIDDGPTTRRSTRTRRI